MEEDSEEEVEYDSKEVGELQFEELHHEVRDLSLSRARAQARSVSLALALARARARAYAHARTH